MDVLREIAA
jgi:ankyrin repeat protein